MSTGQILTVVGAAVGYYFGGPEGAQVGASLGGLAGSAYDASNTHYDAPKVGDLKLPRMQYGTAIPRLYGSNRTSGSLAWYSTKRVIPGSSGGKGGTPSAPTGDSAEIDVLIILAADSNIVGISRVWSNGGLIWTHRADSDPASRTASDSTTAWHSMEFLDGNPNQLPHPVLEASDGVGNVPAYRFRQCVVIDSLQLGGSGQMPVLEFECVTNATSTDGPTVIQSTFRPVFPNGGFTFWYPDPGSFYDLDAGTHFNYYSRDQASININGSFMPSEASYVDDPHSSFEALDIQYDFGLHESRVIDGTYATFVKSGALILRKTDTLSNPFSFEGGDGDSIVAITVECIAEFKVFDNPASLPDQVVGIMGYQRISKPGAGNDIDPAMRLQEVVDLDWLYNSSTYRNFSLFYDAAGRIIYADDIDGGHVAETYDPHPGKTHLAMVFTTTEMRVYIAGVLFFRRLRNFLDSLSGWVLTFGGGLTTRLFGAARPYSEIHVFGFAIRETELYTGENYDAPNFVPPAVIRGPDIGATIKPLPVDLGDILINEWSRCADQLLIDVDEIVGTPVIGFQSTGSVRGSLEALAPIYHFGATCSDRLYLRKRGGDAAMTIAYDDLAAAQNQPAAEPFSLVRANTDEIPQRIALAYTNYLDDYTNGTETGDRGFGDATATTAASTNVVMTPDQAKVAAEVLALQTGVSATTAQITVTDFYAALEPTDRILVPDEDGTLYGMRIIGETYSAGIKQFDLVRDGGATMLVTSGISTSAPPSPALTVVPPASTMILPIDTAILRDADDDSGFYVAASGSSRGSVIYTSTDDVTYSSIASFTTQCVFGTCSTTLGDWTGGRVFDERSRLTVNVGTSGTLASTTRAAMVNDQTINSAAVGVDGRWEIVQFRTATLISAGVYKLSGFLRGSRGTEWASTGHSSGESFALLTAASLRRVVIDAGDIGVAEYYKGVTSGQALDAVTAQTFTDNALGKKPFAPVHLRALGPAATALVTWQRRTRRSTRLASSLGIFCPLGETSEAYDLELRDGGGALLATHSVTTNSWSGDISAASTLTVYQTSSTAGRGYPATLTL
jgi:hypothetical protein